MPKLQKNIKRQEAPQPLRGWKAIGDYLGIGGTAAQRWANREMPVRREGRYTVASRDEISREAHMAAPAIVATTDGDMAAALKEFISALRYKKRKS